MFLQHMNLFEEKMRTKYHRINKLILEVCRKSSLYYIRINSFVKFSKQAFLFMGKYPEKSRYEENEKL